MKLNYTSLQHAVAAGRGGRRERATGLPLAAPVACSPCTASSRRSRGRSQAARRGRAPGLRADRGRRAARRAVLRGARAARRAGCSPATSPRGRPSAASGEAITHRRARCTTACRAGWDAALCGPGPGILGSASALGHGGMLALDSAHAALALGCPTLRRRADVVRRPAPAPPRALPPHPTVLELLLAPVVVALPAAEASSSCRDDGPPRLSRAERRRPRRLRRERPARRARWAATWTRTRCSSPPRWRRAGRSRDGHATMSSRFERARRRDRVGGADRRRSRVERFRHADGEEVEREIVGPPGAVGDRRLRRRARVAGAPAARGGRRVPTCSSCRRASSTRRARRRSRPRKRELAEEIGKAAEHWQRAAARSGPAPGFTDERVHVFLATGLRDVRAPRPTRTSGSRSCPGRSTASTSAIEACRRREVAHRAAAGLRATCCARLEQRPLHAAKERAARGRTPAPWPPPPRRIDALVRGARPRLPRLPGVRARAVAQHAGGLPLRPAAVRRVPGADGGDAARGRPRRPRGASSPS